MDKGFQTLERLLEAAGARHRVLASNIANSDTPGFRARDIDFKKVMGEETMKLQVTDPGHIQPAGAAGAPGEITAEPRDPWADGNNVELDIEVASMTENALLYEAGVSLLSTKMRMLRNALGGR
ncbi:MAG: flagellar basal body rod protein FlgB [Thermodesulfovibrionales bacterium]